MSVTIVKSGVKRKTLLAFAFVALMLAAAGSTSAELTATANHDHIKIDFFYHGSSVSVRGISDQGTDLVIKIASPEGHQELRKKGKLAGFLWMNVGKLTFEKVPNLYSLHSTKKLEDILSRDEMDRYGLGYSALQKHAEIGPVASGDEKAEWFNQFVRFKESSKLYSVSSGKINITEQGRTQNYYVLLDWPYQALPENYTISVYAIKDKKVVETAETHVLVEQVGMVKSLAGMAKNNGAFYGIISILAALGAGFGVGMVFRRGGGAH
ncbi:MAG TPA: TIGR02186 family protein [Thermodesulfovibrionales bacterium]|nr:TIGR02186 family protein [Thermodesulfovibrionales bacterium]